MPGDFDDRLAAVDDALATGSTTDDAPAGQSVTADDGTGARGEVAGDGVASPGASRSPDLESESPPDDDGPTRVDGVARDLSALGDRVAELEAAVEALRGYAGSVRAVNDRVEERADAAVATTESLADRLDQLERRLDEQAAPPNRTARRGSPVAGGRDREGSASPERGGDAPERRDRRIDSTERRDRRAETTGRRGRPGASTARRDRSTAGGGGDGHDRNPRTPYGAVDDADSTEDDGGLVARLRNAL